MSRIPEYKARMSYLPDLNGYQNNSFEEDEQEEGPGPEEEIEGWDVFKYFPPRLKTGSRADTSFFDNLIKFVKLLTYVVLVILVLCGGVIAKLTITFAASQISDDGAVSYCDYNDADGRPTGRTLFATVPEESRILWYWCIFLAFAFPELLGMLGAIYHFFFKRTKWLGPMDTLILLLSEGLHAVGLALLFYLILPEMNSVEAVVVSSCTCAVPALLGLLSRSQQSFSRRRSFGVLVGGVAAFACQVCGIIIYSFSDSENTMMSRWIMPVALILTSCRWWNNYVSSYSNFGFIRSLSAIKERLQATKGITQGFTAMWRILVFLGTFILIAYCKGIEPARFFDKNILGGKHKVTLTDLGTISSSDTQEIDDIGEFTVDSYYLPIIFVTVHASSSFIAYSAGKFAYRALMQGYGFALPIILTVPVTIVTIIALCSLRYHETCIFHGFLPDYIFFDSPTNISSIPDLLNDWYPWIWILTLASQAWITMHIWLPHSERLAATEHIFVQPTYDSLIIDQSMALNRQIDEIPVAEPVAEKLAPEEEAVSIDATYSSSRFSEIGLSANEQSDRVTRIIACATMWHEDDSEMSEFIGSIMRLDTDQGSRRFTQGYYNLHMKEYYDLETHVFFDDAFRCMHGCEGSCKHDENETQVNDYVMDLIKTMKEAVERLNLKSVAPMKYPAPYGGRLEWTLPGKTRLVVHLKDKNKIRHRKRWSQVMYMYYLLGYRLMDRPISRDRKDTIAENTYLLTLDGDIDFRPSAVKVLVDLMKRDKNLGAACGRIHPMGTGPMVWFQKFEYAIGHWLQKSTEHTIGSVLCSPGCFSLFRAKALMEHNVMRKYAIQSTEPRHYVQYDQGEDRWLCTLILQVGYRVEYSAASDSYTHAPETFNEFYNQRRRWIPSTIANIFDLLATSQETRKRNVYISWLYIAYQWVLMGSTVLGPGTIFLMLVGAFVAAFRIDNWSSFGYNLIPIAVFVLVCFTCKARIQLIVAGIISAVYGLVMIVVLVGIMIQITEDGLVAPSTILFFVVAGQLIIAGLLHPQEWTCLLCGVVYYVTVPSMYMLLIIFSLFNVNNVTWGTRDSKPAPTETVQNNDGRNRNDKSPVKNDSRRSTGTGRGSIEFSLAGLFRCMLCTQNTMSEEERKLENITETLDRIGSRLNAMEKNADVNEAQKNRRSDKFLGRNDEFVDIDPASKSATQSDTEEYTDDEERDNIDDESESATESDTYANGSNRDLGNFLVSPHWLQDEKLRKFGVEFLSREEESFWERLIEKYLHPIEEDKKEIAKTAEGLRNLRDEYLFKFFMLNALFVLFVFLMQLNKEMLHFRWPLGVKHDIKFKNIPPTINISTEHLQLEPLGCLFIVGFVGILGIQFIAMLFHRFETFTHVLAKTTVDWFTCGKPADPTGDADLEKHAENVANGLQCVLENHVGSVFIQKTSELPPGKRKTVRELADTQDRRIQQPSSLDTLFRRNLKDPRSEVSRFMSTRMPRHVVEAFEKRRSTIVAERRRSQMTPYDTDNIYNNPDSLRLRNSNRATLSENHYNYDNRAFVSDNYSDNDQIAMAHRPSQVTFSNNVNA